MDSGISDASTREKSKIVSVDCAVGILIKIFWKLMSFGWLKKIVIMLYMRIQMAVQFQFHNLLEWSGTCIPGWYYQHIASCITE